MVNGLAFYALDPSISLIGVIVSFRKLMSCFMHFIAGLCPASSFLFQFLFGRSNNSPLQSSFQMKKRSLLGKHLAPYAESSHVTTTRSKDS